LESGEIVAEGAAVRIAIDAARADVWSGLHHDNADANEGIDDGSDGEDEDYGEQGMDVPGDNEVGYDDWDDDGNGNGLSALDMLGEDFERNLVTNGGHACTIVSIFQLTIRYSWKFERA